MRAIFLIVAGIVYLALVLFDGIESPLFSLVFIGLAAYELVRLHRNSGTAQTRRNGMRG
jgi:hypothetical protein